MKNRFYVLIAAALLVLAGTNLATFYLYTKEKIRSRRMVHAVHEAVQHTQTEATNAVTGLRKDAQQKFMETLSVLQFARPQQNEMQQQILNSLTERNRRVQLFYANRSAGVGEALKIIQKDGEIFGLYNQYLQMTDDREKAFLEKAKPLGDSLGLKAEQ